MDDRLQSKVALVTGGATGIGLATVRRLLAEGCSVMMASRNRERGEGVVADLGNARAAFHQLDVTDESSVESSVEATVQRFGRLDCLFNNAGIEGTAGPMAAWSADVVDAVLDVNVKGAFLCMKHAAPRMASGSVIVNSSSWLGMIPMPVAAPYAASKAALVSLTRSAAAELAEQGISVFAICPAVVDTPMIDRISQMAGAPKTAIAEMVCPSRQVTSPDRVAEVVVGLLASDTPFESGSALRIDPNEVERVGP
ncbi:SDR family NAD(P)-dependent oxidoreductase [Streptomyces sp. ISL-43]|uniref:SDR family NAD(P)-dependent oxidoreductase n=1 Tax=Streptomyces sp. ISL-43 TaxID=2819183 RepID=UPI001BE7AA6E|nr:SDR family NAD(P)-dependent oxidoreductase [Streptomyces sp. ISL-43]MBT2449345.1 SDR family NAD(P)-dependent oxidoreductase [Streptomyces sp. ISL-43]